jgi:hypothetical protein
MRKRRVARPRLESMEDRMVPSPFGSHLASTASAEIRRLNSGLNRTIQQIQNRLNEQHKTRASHLPAHHPTQAHHVAPKQTGNSFWDNLKKAFGF